MKEKVNIKHIIKWLVHLIMDLVIKNNHGNKTKINLQKILIIILDNRLLHKKLQFKIIKKHLE